MYLYEQAYEVNDLGQLTVIRTLQSAGEVISVMDLTPKGFSYDRRKVASYF